MNCKSLDTEFALEFTYTWTRVRFIKYKKKKNVTIISARA